MEEYLLCKNDQLCSRVAEVFEIKSYTIKKMTFPTLIEKLCKKTEKIKAQSKKEINYWIERIKEMELKESMKLEKDQNKVENLKSGEKEIIQQLEIQVSEHREKVQRINF